jgi:hypothetical protein
MAATMLCAWLLAGSMMTEQTANLKKCWSNVRKDSEHDILRRLDG